MNKLITSLLLLTFLLLSLQSVRAEAVQLKELSSSQMNQVIQQNAKVKFVFLFTSWCSACKKHFEQVVTMMKNNKQSDRLQIIVLSLDRELKSLERFVEPFSDCDADVYHFTSTSEHDVHTILKENQIRYQGSIPHMLLIYNGNVVAEGNYRIDSIEQAVNMILEQESSKVEQR